MTFDLGEKLAPKMHRHGGQAFAEHADHVVLERLDGLLGQIAPMSLGGTSLNVILMQTMLGCQVFGVVGRCRVGPFVQVHDGGQE